MLHMSQINYIFAIIDALQKNKNHIRGLAQLLGTNQTMIARKVNELYHQNIVDFKSEGKNKVIFLKKTLEAKQYMYHAELERLIVILKKYPVLRRIIELIQKNKKIRLAILFGSYAKGLVNRDSDIDIYIDTIDKKIKEEVENIDSKIRVKIGKYNKESLLIQEIEKNNIVMKGVEVYYEKNKFFD